MAQGAAIGVAAAFGAPIGGVLFALEEASTYWSHALNWRTLVGSSIAAVLAKLVRSHFTEFSAAGFIEFPDAYADYAVWEILTFAMLAVVTGVLGGYFCILAGHLAKLRKHLFSLSSPTGSSRRARVGEVLLIMFVTSCITYWLPFLFGCETLDSHASGSALPRRVAGSSESQDGAGLYELGKKICPDGEYSDVFVFLMQPKEAAVKLLFSKEMGHGIEMNLPHLIACAAIIYALTLLTFGSAVPCGLFIPHILCGAILGRAFGETLLHAGFEVHAGVYALMGSTGMVCGFSRMTICLAMIFLEITSSMRLLVPLIVTILLSKTVADRLSFGINHVMIEQNKRLNMLEDELTEDRTMVLDRLNVHDVCTAEVVVLREREKTEHIVGLMMQSAFAGYPIVTGSNRLVGLVTRPVLTHALAQKLKDENGMDMSNEYINVRSLSDAPPEVTYWNRSVAHCYRHFKAAGLQHLCIINERNELLGILTRTDFAHLCHPGQEGVDYIKSVIARRHAAIAAGMMTSDGRIRST
eukprot:gnl/TRDRNA2_/TRDRNA2_170294_c2_seq6.p1 gnl/TRDRNA2_/TRDRNA2_170294_c2~~gnl/TRDRNA2_/TRDRNA2_170294_c2_seq6.p1  ORF type:complete len:526 (+),score=79.43 gnl/TRDRNA2_/TRDRNA2_170294_c2_seq6:117-1694(+)